MAVAAKFADWSTDLSEWQFGEDDNWLELWLKAISATLNDTLLKPDGVLVRMGCASNILKCQVELNVSDDGMIFHFDIEDMMLDEIAIFRSYEKPQFVDEFRDKLAARLRDLADKVAKA